MKLSELDTRLQALGTEQTELVDKCQSLVDADGDFGDEQQAEFDKYQARIEAIEAERREVQTNLDRLSRLQQHRQTLETPQPRISPQPQPTNRPEETPVARVVSKPRYGRLKAFESADDAYAFGQWLRGGLFGDVRAAQWCRDRGLPFQNSEGEQRQLSTNVNLSGGFLVPETFAASIINNQEQYGVARRVARVVPMSSDVENWPKRTGSVTTYYVSDNTAITTSSPTFGQAQLTARKLATLTQVSSELSEDAAISVADFLADDIANQFALAEDNAMFIGDGTSTYGGMYGFNPQFEANTSLTGWVQAVTAANDTIPELDIADFTAAMGQAPMYTIQSAASRWVMSHVCWAHVQNLLFNAGGSTPTDITGAVRPSLFGFPVEVSQVMPANRSTDYTDSAIALFGDFTRACLFGDRRTITVQVDGSYYFNVDALAVRATERFHINVHDVGTTAAAGPVVCLAGGSG